MNETLMDVENWVEERDEQEISQDVKDLTLAELDWIEFRCRQHGFEGVQEIVEGEIRRREDEQLDKWEGYLDNEDEEEEKEDNNFTEVWDSGLEVIEDFEQLARKKLDASSLADFILPENTPNKVVVPEEVRKTLVAAQRKVNQKNNGKCEFGILFKGEWTDNGFEIRNDYVIPEQTASTAHINYSEDLKKYRDQGYIVNIHSHPSAGENAGFSGTDDEHINSHFQVAALFAGKAETVAGAIANIETENGDKVQLKPSVQVQEELPELELENIETRSIGKNNRTKKKAASTYRTKNKKGNYLPQKWR